MAAEQDVLAKDTEHITRQPVAQNGDRQDGGLPGNIQSELFSEAMGGRDVRAPYVGQSPTNGGSRSENEGEVRAKSNPLSEGEADLTSKLRTAGGTPAYSIDSAHRDDSSQAKEFRYEANSETVDSRLFQSAYSSQAAQSDSQDTPSERNSALIAGRNENLVAAALPELTIGGQRAPETIILPWNAGDKRHMSYDLMKDVRVKINEGPFHVAERILGKDGDDADKRALTKALKEQFAEETAKDPNTQGIRIGYPLVTERNIYQILMRIEDPACRTRIIERVRQGFTDVEQAKPVPLDARNRPGETRPDRIDDGAAFMKDLAAAAIEVGAHKLWAKGKCAQGARLAFNELPHWNIEGGVVDKVISKDPNGWRSGIILAKDLADSGLFDVIPLKDFGYKNLKEGHVLGRYHYPDYVKDRPSWGGEDYGDIDIVTKVHRPPNDGDTYHSSFVLVPKRKK